jgi:hypothetical protein
VTQENTRRPAPETSLFDPNDTVNIRRTGKPDKKVAYVIALFVAAVAIYFAYNKFVDYRADQALAAAQTENKARYASAVQAENSELKAKLQAAEAKLQAATTPPPAPKASAATGWGVVVATLYQADQRSDAAAKSVNALSICKANGDESLRYYFIEVGNKARSRFATELVAIGKTPMTETQATNLAKCLDSNLPKLDSGETVGAFASNLDSKRYAGKERIAP